MIRQLDGSNRLRSFRSRYLCALLSVAVAIGVRQLLKPMLGQQFPFGALNIAVAITAWYAGTRPALVALFAGALLSDFLVIGVHQTLAFRSTRDTVGLLLFLSTGLAISLLAGGMHNARRRADFFAESSAESDRYRDALIDQTYEPVLMWEWDGPILLWNHGAEQLYGYTREEAIGQISHDLLHTETEGGVAHFLAAMEREGRWAGELKHTGRDGQTVYVDSHMALIRDAKHAFVIESDRDITERKKREAELVDLNDRLESLVQKRTEELVRTHESLRASEEHNRLILEGVRSHAIFMLGPSGDVVSWSPGAERIKRYKAEEVLGKNFSMFYTPEERESGTPALELEIAAKEGSFENESLRVRKGGSRFWASVSLTALTNQNKEPIGFVKVLQDITDRKAMEQALRNAESKLQLLVNGVSNYAIVMLDPEGMILTWSRGAELIDGYSADEIIGKNYSCLFPAESIRQGEPERELARAAAEGKVDIEGWRIRKDGSTFWANGTLAALYDENCKARGFAKITRDLTTKRHDDELLQSVLDHTLDGILTIDVHGTVSMMNRAGETLFGRSADEVVGQNINMLMPQPYRAEHDSYLANYMGTGEAKVIGIGREVQGLRKDGSVFPIDLAVTEFQLDSKRYFVGIVRDISEKKTLEAQLQQSQKMEAFGQLAGGVAHDFNNLLTVIFGYAELLKTELDTSDPRVKMVDQVMRAGNRAASLTQQLLAFSRQQLLETKVLDVNLIVTEIESMLRRVIGEDIQLSMLLEPNLSSVKVDPGQIGQVLLNFCLNARDAMAPGGKITIETKQVELDTAYTKRHPEAHSGPHVMVAVSDTGCGMEQGVLARIFEPFFTTKEVGQGTGLGLAVVHGIIKQSGGSIDVYSEVNVGTTFKIYLPAIQPQSRVESVQATELAVAGAETILFVEDEESLRELGKIILEKCGYKVLVACDGEAALKLISGNLDEIDLLITDVVMPQMGGRKLAETLQEKRPELKVLFLSGYTDDAVVRHGVLQAHVHFLQKPFSSNTLSKRVREILDNP